MQSPKAVQIELKIDQLKDRLYKYVRSVFDEWTHSVPTQIQEKIKYPLFIFNSDKTIRMNFPKEVIKL